MTWGNVLSNVLVGGWLALRAVDAYNHWTAGEEERDAASSQHSGSSSQQGFNRRVVQRGPVTFVYTSGGGGLAGAYGLPGGPGMRVGPSGEEEGEESDGMFGGLDLLNLRLGMVDRDFTEDDYEILSALDRSGPTGRGAPVSQDALNSLPQHAYHPRKQAQQQSAQDPASAAAELPSEAAAAPGGPWGASSSGPSYHDALQAAFGGDRGASAPSQLRHRPAAGGSGSSGGGSGFPSAPPLPGAAVGSGGGRPGAAEAGAVAAADAVAADEVRACSICLEQFQEGEQVTSLPCLHQFHGACVQPWLRQQGRNSACPECKTPVFH